MSDFLPVVEASVGDRHRPLVVGEVTRAMFVRFAGASGDFNPLHWDREYAVAAGYPDVFGMGMFGAGLLGTFLTEWMGEASVRSFRVRFVGQLWAGDELRCSGEVVRLFEDGQTWADCDLVLENGRGESKILGSATCAVLSGRQTASMRNF